MDRATEELLREGSVRIIFSEDDGIQLKDLRRFLELFELAGKKLCTIPRIRDCAAIITAAEANPQQQLSAYLQRKNIYLKELSKASEATHLRPLNPPKPQELKAARKPLPSQRPQQRPSAPPPRPKQNPRHKPLASNQASTP